MVNYCHFSQTRKLNCVSVFVCFWRTARLLLLPLTTHNWGLEWTIVLCAAVQLLISFSLSVKYCCYFDWFSVCKFLAKTLPGMIFECKSYLFLRVFPSSLTKFYFVCVKNSWMWHLLIHCSVAIACRLNVLLRFEIVFCSFIFRGVCLFDLDTIVFFLCFSLSESFANCFFIATLRVTQEQANDYILTIISTGFVIE